MQINVKIERRCAEKTNNTEATPALTLAVNNLWNLFKWLFLSIDICSWAIEGVVKWLAELACDQEVLGSIPANSIFNDNLPFN